MKKYNAIQEEEAAIEARRKHSAHNYKKPAEGGHQTKLESVLEQICNTGSGMIIAYVIMECILAPMLHIGITPMQNVWTTIILTTVSVLRGYVWRRIFNKRMYKHWANWLRSKVK